MNVLALAILTIGTLLGSSHDCQGRVDKAKLTAPIVRPGVGSTFIIRRRYWDTTGALTQDYLDTEVVFKSGITFAGKNNVIAVSLPADPAILHGGYYDYEPNGDFDDYSDIPGVRDGWRTYPIASKGTTSFVQVDSSYIDPSTGRRVNWYREFVMTYVKDTSMEVAGQKMKTVQVHFQAGNGYRFQNFTSYVWIAPSIGFEVRTTQRIGRPYLQNCSGWEWDLVSYTLK